MVSPGEAFEIAIRQHMRRVDSFINDELLTKIELGNKFIGVQIMSTTTEENKQLMTVSGLVEQSYSIADEHGFWQGEEHNFMEKLMLIVTEVAEAAEDHRAGRGIAELYFIEKNGKQKPCGIPSELADIVIRVCDMAGKYGVDLEEAIRVKAEYNKSREFMHGKTC